MIYTTYFTNTKDQTTKYVCRDEDALRAYLEAFAAPQQVDSLYESLTRTDGTFTVGFRTATPVVCAVTITNRQEVTA